MFVWFLTSIFLL